MQDGILLGIDLTMATAGVDLATTIWATGVQTHITMFGDIHIMDTAMEVVDLRSQDLRIVMSHLADHYTVMDSIQE